MACFCRISTIYARLQALEKQAKLISKFEATAEKSSKDKSGKDKASSAASATKKKTPLPAPPAFGGGFGGGES